MQGYSPDPQNDRRLALEYAESAATSRSGTAVRYAGQAFGFLGDFGRAETLCRRAYEMYPRFVPAKWQLAQCLLYAGKPRESLDLYLEAETTQLPGQWTPKMFMAQGYEILGDLDQALLAAREGADQRSGVIQLSVLANVLACLNRIDEAAAAIQRIKDEVLPPFTIRACINAYHRTFATDEAREAVTSGLQKLMDLGYE